MQQLFSNFLKILANLFFTLFITYMITPINQSQYTPNFTARCPEIRDAEWVCRVINHTFPHYSTTKQQIRIINLLKRNRSEIKYEKTPKVLAEVYEIFENYIPKITNSKLAKQLTSIKEMLEKTSTKRFTAERRMGRNKTFESLYLMEMFKFGNCTESAIIAELILKMNGIQNACCASLNKGLKRMPITEWTDLDHLICVFNKDGSIFTGTPSKHTIFIDPWLNKAGFAKDMERFYRNEFSHFFKLDPDEVFKYEPAYIVDISDFAMSKVKDKYHPFIFKNPFRKFMQRVNDNK